MVEQQLPVLPVNVRLRPHCISNPRLATLINLFLDCTAPTSLFGNPQGSENTPFGDPFRRILVWGAPGVGKHRDLGRIVEAFGPDSALLVSGAELSSRDTYDRTIELLRHAKHTGEVAVIAIGDYDAGTDDRRPSLFDSETAETSSREGVAEPTPMPAAPIESKWPVDRSDDRRGALALLRSGRTHPVSDTSSAASRILLAVRTERVPALVICSTSTNMADPHALATAAGLFDQVVYAPLPPFTSMEKLWEDALGPIPLRDDVHIDELASLSEGLTAPDVSAILRKAITEAYLAKQRPLEDLKLGQADLLAALLSARPLFERWVRSAEPRRPEFLLAGVEERAKPPLPYVASDLDRYRRGNNARALAGPDLLHQAALGELSACVADGSESGWDALLNGGLD